MTYMLNSLKIRNFRCLQEIDVELKPLTILIGANNTGKSAFLDAIRLLGPGDFHLKKTDIFSGKTQNSGGETRFFEIEAQNQDRSFSCLVEEKHSSLKSQRSALFPAVSFIRLPSAGAQCTSGGISDSQSSLILSGDGSNLAAVLDYMLRNHRKRFLDLLNALGNLIPGFEDLNIATPEPASRHIEVVLDNGIQLSGNSLSAGVRHLIFFATLAYHPSPPSLILIEEPEQGVHPKRLGDIVRLLRGISHGEHSNHPAQVILSTHSPYLLDHVDLDKDQVLVFQRRATPEGERIVQPVDQERLKVFLDEFMLGEIWYNNEEEGLVSKKS